jgi:hypothetical protein
MAPRLRPPLQWDPQRRELALALDLARLGAGQQDGVGGGAPSTYFCPPLPLATVAAASGAGDNGAAGENSDNCHYRLDVEVGRLELALASSGASSADVVVVVTDGGGAAADDAPAAADAALDRLERELLSSFREHRRMFQQAQQHQRELAEQHLNRAHDALLAARERLLACSAAVQADLARFQSAAPPPSNDNTSTDTKTSVLVEGCTTNARRAALAEAALALGRAERRARALRRRLEAPRRRLLRSAARLAEAQRRLDEEVRGLSSSQLRLRVAFRGVAANSSSG